MNEVPSAFHQLGYEDADELLIKAQLVKRIHDTIKAQGLTQEAAAAIIGMPRPEVSNLLRGRLSRFTIDRLVRALNALEPQLHVRVFFEEPRSPVAS